MSSFANEQPLMLCRSPNRFYKGENFASKFRYHVERQICLRSAFVHKKHREQYEWRTYVLIAKLLNLTESTADTYLEYIERNLPEGCSMIVHKYEGTRSSIISVRSFSVNESIFFLILFLV